MTEQRERSEQERLLKEIKGLVLEAGRDPTSLLLDIVHREGALESVRFLLEKGADPNIRLEKNTSLDLSAWTHMGRRLEMIKLLLEYGGDPNAKYLGTTPLDLAFGKGFNAEGTARRKYDFGKGKTPLHILCYCGGVEVVKVLVEKGGIDANMVMRNACLVEDLSIVNYLLSSKDVNVDINTTYGFIGTPIYFACKLGSLELVKLLMEHDANINAPNVDGCLGGGTPLHAACSSLHKTSMRELVQFLLENHANIHATDSHGNTPLHDVWQGRDSNNDRDTIGMIEQLLEKGANINATNKEGATPLCYACRSGKLRVVQFLLQTGADVVIGKSPLYTAAGAGHFHVTELLLQNGALLNNPRLGNDCKTIRFSNEHELQAAKPLIARIARAPCLGGRLQLTLGKFPWNKAIQSHCEILLANNFEELNLSGLCQMECLQLLTRINYSIRFLTVIVERAHAHYHSAQVCSALCELLESNDRIEKLKFMVDHRTIFRVSEEIGFIFGSEEVDRHHFATGVMHSLITNSTLVSFSAPPVILDVTQWGYKDSKAMVTQLDADCICLRNKSWPLMMKAGHQALWPRMLHRISNKTSQSTEKSWGASAMFGLIQKAVPAWVSSLTVE